jgi:hypothetical protein
LQFMFSINQFYFVRSRFAVACTLCLGMFGCTSRTEVKPLYCPPPPEPVCAVGNFDKTLLDTVFHGPGHVQSHITMLPAPENSNADDYAITFIPVGGGYLSLISNDRTSAADNSSSTGVQEFYSAKFIRTTLFGPMKNPDIGLAPTPIGAGFYSKADGLFYFSAKAHNTDPDDFDLYAAKVSVNGDEISFSEIRPLTALNSEGHFDSQPTLDPSGTHIYFVSDRPGGNGGTDIWYSERSSATSSDWSAPQPLPEPVNSACDELCPFIPPGDPNILYFASNGHETVGGYDLFKTHVTNGRFSEPENLGEPINTASDELFPTVLNDTAFFWSSNMPADEGGMNLYTITRTYVPQITAQGRVPQERPTTAHLQFDTAHPARLDTARPAVPAPVLGPVQVIALVTRGTPPRPAVGSDVYVHEDSAELYRGTVPASGEIGFKLKRDHEYDVGAETEEAFYDVKHLDLRGYKDSVAKVELHLPDTLVLRINFPFDDYEHPYEFTIDDNGQASSTMWTQAIDLAAHSALRSIDHLKQLIIIGYTDSLGSDTYNERLGFRRASFVASEIEKRGIPKKIIRVKSKGRTEPVSRRPGESDEIFRLRSRRVEFIKVFD